MRVLVCGSRHFHDKKRMKEVLDSYDITEIIEGEAKGADLLARSFGEKFGIPVRAFPADWNTFGRAAGSIRNNQMLVEGKPELVIAFWDEKSRGTQNMINQAIKAGVEVRVVDV